MVLLLVGARTAALGMARQNAPKWTFPAEHVDAMVEDLRRLAAAPPLAPCGTTRDAGVVFERILEVEGRANPLAAPPWWQHDEVYRALKANDSSWWQHVEDAPRGDLSVTAELLAYDGWSGVLPATRAALEREGGPGVTVLELRSFNVMTLPTLAKLRVLEGLRNGEPVPALREVRQLARLVSCDESLVPQMVAVSILGVEARGYELAVERGLMPAEAWSPIPAEHRKALKRATFGLAAVYAGLAPAGSRERVEAVGGPFPGRCAALAEAVELTTLHRDLLGKRYPFEVDHGQPFREIDALLAASPCPLPVSRAYWSHPEWTDHALTKMTGGNPIDWARLPWVRDIAFYSLVAGWGMNYDHYGEAEE